MKSGNQDLFVSIPPNNIDIGARVEQCSWSVLGGPDQALITLPGESVGLEVYRHLLGKPIEILTSTGSKVWWGYVSAIRNLNEQFPQTIDLEGMANRVSACYEELEPGKEPGQDMQTSWYENLPSQADYGVKEKVLKFGMVSSAQASQGAARYLTDHAWPVVTAGEHSVITGQQGLNQNGKSNSQTQLVCLGWIYRLRYRTWQTKSGMLGHSPTQVGYQKIGEVAANQRLAQSFKVDLTQNVSYIQLRFRKEGSPTDSLTISIQSDNAGLPSGTALASATLSGSALSAESYQWHQVNFPTLPSITAGVNYWLVIRRSGLLDPAAYYLAGLDEGAGYLDGMMRIYNSSNGQWTMRSPTADLLFKFGLLKASDELAQELLNVVAADLNGFQVEMPTGFTLAPFLAPMDGLSALEMLMELGGADLNPLLASVNADKWLRVFPQPDASTAAFMIDQEGNLCDRYGNQVGMETQVAGQWVLLGERQAVFVREVSWDSDSKRLTIYY